MKKYCENLLIFLEEHRKDTLTSIPEEGRTVADLLFEHHVRHVHC